LYTVKDPPSPPQRGEDVEKKGAGSRRKCRDVNVKQEALETNDFGGGWGGH